jgi:hypothetical protein
MTKSKSLPYEKKREIIKALEKIEQLMKTVRKLLEEEITEKSKQSKVI